MNISADILKLTLFFILLLILVVYWRPNQNKPTMDILKAFDILIKFEGTAFTNIKEDAGGATKFGVSQKFNPDIDVKNLTLEQARDIYDKRYWQPGHCANMKPELQYIHFDTCVNMGIGEALMILGHITKEDTDTFPAYLSRRLEVYDEIIKNRPEDRIFEDGWENRLKRINELFKNGELA